MAHQVGLKTKCFVLTDNEHCFKDNIPNILIKDLRNTTFYNINACIYLKHSLWELLRLNWEGVN